MTTETANDTEAVKAKVTEFLTGLMKQSNLHFTDFFEAVEEACLDLEERSTLVRRCGGWWMMRRMRSCRI
jgi:hypothetical protein